jgi:hypothetical protein
MQEVQHQGAVRHRLAEIAGGVCQALHLATVLPHGEFPLGELVELGVEVKSSSVPVPEELFLEGEPRLMARVRLVADDVLELDGDSSVEPGEHHGVHQGPGRGRRGDDVVKDVVIEGVAPKVEEDLAPAARVVRGRRVQNDGHEGLDVVKSDGLRVEGGDVVDVESSGKRYLRSCRWYFRGDRRLPEEKTLSSCHLGVRAVLMARSGCRTRVTACSRSRETSMTACMVAMAVTSADEVGGGGGAVTSGHVVVARAEKPGGEPRRRSSCCCAVGEASRRGPRQEI